MPSGLGLAFDSTCLCYLELLGVPGSWRLLEAVSPTDRLSPLLCLRQVDLYGFGADSKGNWHHYWENNPSAGAFRKTGVHDGDFESNVTATLASINKIRIFKGR